MDIKDILLNQSFTAILGWEDSQSSDTVTYSIIKSDGTSFGTGSATWVSNGLWKVAFTPTTDGETYIVILSNATLDVIRTAAFRAVQRPAAVVASISGTTPAELLTAVENAIKDILSGGGVKQYMLNGRAVTYEDLGKLMEMRRQLMSEVNAARTSADHHTLAEFGGI